MPALAHTTEFAAVRRRILVTALIVAVSVTALAGFALRNDYRRAEADAQRDLRNLLIAVSEHTEWTLWSAESLVNRVHAAVERQQQGTGEADAAALQELLREAHAPGVDAHQWFVADARGGLLTSSDAARPQDVTLVDRDYYRANLERRDDPLYIGQPVLTRPGGVWAFTLTRAVRDARGNLRGVAGATVRLPYLIDFFSRLDLGDDGTVVLLRPDGQVLVRYPFSPQAVQMRVSELEQRLQDFRRGVNTFRTTSPFDGRDRMVALTEVRSYPVVASISVSMDRILDRWWHNARAQMLVVALVLPATALSTWAQWRHVHELESATRRALTDRLTRLPNRRAFDQHVQSEWRRALRGGTALALLMIDIDHFKLLNDRLGHAAGDDCLQRIADLLTSQARRAGDMVARWGGEEFVCLLPDCGATDATAIAEAMRAAVEAEHIAHPASATGPWVTVSIGVAGIVPDAQATPAALLESADAQLYVAKQAGRNRVALQQAVPGPAPVSTID